jgi:ribosomal protein S18 acetylase RimI-like enzyme
MGTITALDPDMNSIDKVDQPVSLLTQVKRAEKKTFSRDEAMDFDMELKKRNTELIVVLEKNESLHVHEIVSAYLLYARLHGVALLHKVCTLEGYQRQGIARRMLSRLKNNLQSQGCEKLQLWVDESRTPARSLYESLDFRITDRARDYYGPGRTGIKMVLDLNSVW